MANYSSELTADKLGNSGLLQHYNSLRGTRRTATIQPKSVHSMKTMYCSLSVCSVLIALLGISYLLFDPLVKHIVLKRLVLRNNSEFAEIWANPPITPHLKVYFFNFTNPDDFFQGKAKPILKEVGPYTYHQKWIKENVTWHGNGTMTYSTRKDFTFIPELSVGHQSKDNLTVLNVPAISAMYQMRYQSFFHTFALSSILYTLGYNSWITKTPEELIWGYHEPLFDLAKLTLPNPPPLDKFGFFTKKNVSQALPTYTMYTGEGNPYNLSKISLFNGSPSLNIWNGTQCNKVQGSDGATFNPYIQEEDTLWFFNDQLCQSLPMVFDQNVKSRDLPGYRFKPRHDVFKNDPVLYPDNSCYCEGEELCSMIGDGMFAVAKCQFDAPVVLSWPHFLHANSTFQQSVEGLNPDANKHGFWFDIQPTTGTTLSAKARVQINLAVKHINSFSMLSKINDTVVPMLWFEEGLDELGPELLDVIGQAVVEPPVYKNYVLFMLMGVTTATLAIFIVTCTRLCLNMYRMKQFRMHEATEEGSNFHQIPQNNILIGQNLKNPINNLKKKGHAHNPSQGSGKFLLDSEDSSPQSSTNHSRNSSTGSTPPTTSTTNDAVQNSQEDQEQERLLQQPPQPGDCIV